MNKAMTMFDFDAESVRALVIDGDPWLVGKDVCRALGIANHNDALGRLDEDERRYHAIGTPTAKGVGIADPLPEKGVDNADPLLNQQQLVMISESGVYRLVFTSRSEAAERFKRWLAHVVLPSLRKTGRFEIPERAARPARERRILEEEAIDLDSAPTSQVRLAVSLLREVRIIFGASKARRVARRISVIADVLGIPDDRTEAEGDEDEVSDGVTNFALDRLTPATQGSTRAADIWTAYLKWCEDNEEAPVTQTMLGRRLRLMGYEKKQGGGIVRYVGVVILNEDGEE